MRFTGEPLQRFMYIFPTMTGPGSRLMTNRVGADPHPVTGALPAPPRSFGQPSGSTCIFIYLFMKALQMEHIRRMEISWYIWCTLFPVSPVQEKDKLAPRFCLFPSDFIATGHNKTEPCWTHVLMGELRHKHWDCYFLTSSVCHGQCYKYHKKEGG